MKYVWMCERKFHGKWTFVSFCRLLSDAEAWLISREEPDAAPRRIRKFVYAGEVIPNV